MFQLTIQKLPWKGTKCEQLVAFFRFKVRFQPFVFTRVYMICEIDFDDLTQSFDMSYMIYTYTSLLATSHNLSPLKKCWFHPQTPNPKKKKTPKKNDSGDSWMYPNQRTPTRNPYISPREYNKYHGYTVRGRPNCPLNDPNDYCKQYTTRNAGRLPCSLSPSYFPESFHLFGRLAGRCLRDFMTTKFPWKYGLVYQVLNKRPIGCKTCASKHSNRIPSICVYNSPGLWTKFSFYSFLFSAEALEWNHPSVSLMVQWLPVHCTNGDFPVSFVSVQQNLICPAKNVAFQTFTECKEQLLQNLVEFIP